MAHFIAKIKDPIGLHARPASVIVQAASKFKDVDFFLHWDEKSGNLKSIFNIMALGVMHGAEVKVEAKGLEADEAIKVIQAVMIEQKLI